MANVVEGEDVGTRKIELVGWGSEGFRESLDSSELDREVVVPAACNGKGGVGGWLSNPSLLIFGSVGNDRRVSMISMRVFMSALKPAPCWSSSPKPFTLPPFDKFPPGVAWTG